MIITKLHMKMGVALVFNGKYKYGRYIQFLPLQCILIHEVPTQFIKQTQGPSLLTHAESNDQKKKINTLNTGVMT